MAGFTTVRDVGSDDYIDVGLRNAIARRGGPRPADAGGGPRPRRARRATATTSGFPYQPLRPRAGDRARHRQPAPDQFREAVRYQVKYGADVIKVCATGGVLSLGDEVDTPQLTQEEINASSTRRTGSRKKVAAHAPRRRGREVAIRAGVDSIEHGSFLTTRRCG